jgi:PAS domain S-box-containing protein
MNPSIMEKALGAAGFAVLVLDEAERVIDITPPAALLLGVVPQDLIGTPVADLLPMGPIRALTLEQGGPRPKGPVIEVTLRDKDRGPALPVAVNAMAWTAEDGRRLTTVFLRDIAVEKEIARQAQNQLVRSDNAIRGANIGVFEYDPATNTVEVSDIWRRMLEISPREKLDVQKEWRSRVHPDDLEDALRPVKLCLEAGTERASCEYRLHSRDRTHWRWLRTDIAVAARDALGRPSLLVGAQTDITERKTTEDALRISTARFRSAFDNAPIGKMIVALDGSFLMVNSALCDLMGYSEEDLLQMGFQALTHPDDLAQDLEQMKALIAGRIGAYTVQKRFFRSNGATMWCWLSVGMVRDAEGRPDHFVSQVVDITEQRRMEEMRNTFVSVVSHELRTPLTAILGALTLLEFDDESGFTDEVQRLLFIARTNGDRLHHLINDILDFQKFSAKEMRISLAAVRLVPLIEDTLLANLASADRYGVRFGTQGADRTLMGLVDPKRFHQVMANLLSNAAKFARHGSVVEVALWPEAGAIRIGVTNEGEGIPEAFRDRVFKPFSQAKSVSDRRSGGTGLGLSISKQIVEQMGGEIGFDSIEGAKTTFWFTVRTAEG